MKEVLNQDGVFSSADELYRFVNPDSKMCTPNVVYATTEKWYKEYEKSDSELSFIEWVKENKTPKAKG